MKHKGYEAVVRYSEEDRVFVGEIININDVIAFDATSVEELEETFKEVVEDYLATCEEVGKSPDKPFTGKVALRISPDLHRAIFSAARKEDRSVNKFIARVLKEQVGG